MVSDKRGALFGVVFGLIVALAALARRDYLAEGRIIGTVIMGALIGIGIARFMRWRAR